jgi:NAD+ synthase
MTKKVHLQIERVNDHIIVHWLAFTRRKCKSKRFVIGISGGVDSAVTLLNVVCTNRTASIMCRNAIHQAQSHVTRGTLSISNN